MDKSVGKHVPPPEHLDAEKGKKLILSLNSTKKNLLLCKEGHQEVQAGSTKYK